MVLCLDAKYTKSHIDMALEEITRIISGLEDDKRSLSIHRLGKSLPVSTTKGWRSKIFYREENKKFKLVGVRRTKRGAIMFQLGGEAVESKGCIVAEVHVDEDRDVFNGQIAEIINFAFKGNIEDIISGCINAGGSIAPYTTNVASKEQSKKLIAADLYSDWGDWS